MPGPNLERELAALARLVAGERSSRLDRAAALLRIAEVADRLVRVNVTAAREEKRLSESEFGAEYRAYLQTTGRFFPKLGGGAREEKAA